MTHSLWIVVGVLIGGVALAGICYSAWIFCYFFRFIALMIALFAFVATVAFVVNEWRPFDFWFSGE